MKYYAGPELLEFILGAAMVSLLLRVCCFRASDAHINPLRSNLFYVGTQRRDLNKANTRQLHRRNTHCIP